MVSQPFEFVKRQMVKLFNVVSNEEVNLFWTGCGDGTNVLHVCTLEWKGAQPTRRTRHQMERRKPILRSFRYGESVK